MERERFTAQGPAAESASPVGRGLAAAALRSGLTPAAVLQLQRTAGNAAVTAIVRRRLARVAAASRMCCEPEAIREPDVAGSRSGRGWRLTIAADKESDDWFERAVGSVGHTWVKLTDDTGARFSYGFYPETGVDASGKSVPGCVVHPDVSHEPPRARHYIDVGYEITEAGFDKALSLAEERARRTPEYNLYLDNCTTFVIEMAEAAGVETPTDFTPFDNPNAMYDGILRERDRRLQQLLLEMEPELPVDPERPRPDYFEGDPLVYEDQYGRKMKKGDVDYQPKYVPF